jgi:hypothetical protein
MPRSFIVSFNGREGSSAIIRAFEHADAVRIPLFEHFDQYACPEVMEGDVPAILDRLLRSGEFIKARTDLPKESNTSANACSPVAFKWRVWGEPGRVAQVLKAHDVVVFELMRRDIVNLALSLYLNKHVLPTLRDTPYTEIFRELHPQFQVKWLPDAEKEALLRLVRSQRFAVDIRKFIAIMERYRADRQRIRDAMNTFESFGVEVHTLFYEDFLADPVAFLTRMSMRVGIPIDPTRASFYTKVNRPDVRLQVENLDSLQGDPTVQRLMLRFRLIAKNPLGGGEIQFRPEAPVKSAPLSEARPSNSRLRVTFIVAACNAALTLERTINSILAQRLREWEVLIIDDGSVDPTFELARTWEAKDPRIRAYHQGNCGLSSDRNRGLELARTDWIAFLDPGETIDSDHLATLIAPIRSDPGVDVVCCGHVLVDKDGLDRGPIEAGAGPYPKSLHGVLARRQLILDVGLFDENLRADQDRDLCTRLARGGARLAIVPGQPLSWAGRLARKVTRKLTPRGKSVYWRN